MDEANMRALEAAQAIMDQSTYPIWPADAKVSIATGLLTFATTIAEEATERAARIADQAYSGSPGQAANNALIAAAIRSTTPESK